MFHDSHPSIPSFHLTRDLPTELPEDAGRAAAGIGLLLLGQVSLVLAATAAVLALPSYAAAAALAVGALLLPLGHRAGHAVGHRGLLVGTLGAVGVAVLAASRADGATAGTALAVAAGAAALGLGSLPGLLTWTAPDEAALNRGRSLLGLATVVALAAGLGLGLGTAADPTTWATWVVAPAALVVVSLGLTALDETPHPGLAAATGVPALPAPPVVEAHALDTDQESGRPCVGCAAGDAA
ncbi:MAG: hypothetical protein CMH83_20425 [Nocardioides sp.]|nr:hypothetical protein [Nocardioides sp.]